MHSFLQKVLGDSEPRSVLAIIFFGFLVYFQQGERLPSYLEKISHFWCDVSVQSEVINLLLTVLFQSQNFLVIRQLEIMKDNLIVFYLLQLLGREYLGVRWELSQVDLTLRCFQNFSAETEDISHFLTVVWVRLEVGACPPALQSVRLEGLHQRLHVNPDCPVRLAAGAGPVPLAVLHPARRTEVGSLRNIEAVVEAGVVSVREDNDEISLLLDHLVDQDSPAGQEVGRDHADFVSEKVEADLSPVWEEFPGRHLQPVALARGDAVPGLGSPVVEIVDAVQIHVLDMPGECCPPHSEVEIGSVLHLCQSPTEVIENLVLPDVPDLLVRVNQTSGNVGPVDRVVSPVYLVVAPVETLQLLVTVVGRGDESGNN